MSNNDGIFVEVPVETPVQQQPTSKMFTEEDVAAIRRQEKDKLYKKMEEEAARVRALEEQLSAFAAEKEETAREVADRVRKEQEILRQREIEELSAKELLAKREDEFNSRLRQIEEDFSSRLAEVESQRQAQEALLEKERQLQALESYRQRRIAEEQETIIPELRDLISGNSEEEIDTSVAVLRDRSSAIIASIQQASQSTRLKGAPVTAPPTGPLENNTEYQTLTAEDIRNMPLDQYGKMRERLMNATRPQRGRF